MPPRKIARLGYSEYVAAGPEASPAVWRARLELIDAVNRVFPEMLKRLSADVLPAYAELASSGFNFDAILWNSRNSPHKMLPDGEEDDIRVDKQTGRITPVRHSPRLKVALSDWASAFHCGCSWLLDDAIRTLQLWHVAPGWKQSLRWTPSGPGGVIVATGEPFRFECGGWEMQNLTWATYAKSLRERFERKLAEYEVSSRKLAESRGLVRTPHKYSPSNFEWFVLYQFKGLSSTQIAERMARRNPNVDESTVLKGVKAAARLTTWDRLRTPSPKRTTRKIR